MNRRRKAQCTCTCTAGDYSENTADNVVCQSGGQPLKPLVNSHAGHFTLEGEPGDKSTCEKCFSQSSPLCQCFLFSGSVFPYQQTGLFPVHDAPMGHKNHSTFCSRTFINREVRAANQKLLGLLGWAFLDTKMIHEVIQRVGTFPKPRLRLRNWRPGAWLGWIFLIFLWTWWSVMLEGIPADEASDGWWMERQSGRRLKFICLFM